MKNISFKELIPYVTAILLFYLITVIYFAPLFQGKRIQQSDILHYKGASKEISDYREKTGDEALWTNSMFGGMPAYQISVVYSENALRFINNTLKLNLPSPAGNVFLYFVGFFILLLVLGVNPWLSIVGAIAFAFSSYFFIILEAGHNTKANAIAYMAPVLAGVILAYRGKLIWGSLITALFLGLEIVAGHPQITYYLLIIVLIYGIYELIYSIQQKTLQQFVKTTAMLLVAVVFALLTNTTNMWTTYEYSKETIRGKSELSIDQDNKTTGLDKDYATQWSYGLGESFSFLVPNAKGGGSGLLGNNAKIMNNVAPQMQQNIARSNQYWGDQPGTSGPVYVGAIILLLFTFGMFILKGRLRWVLFTATIVSLMLSWGKNFMPLTDIFLDYFPLYNKFRAVSMILVIAELCIPLVAILALNEIAKNPGIIKQKRKELYISFGLTGGLALLFYIAPSLFFSFLSQVEASQFSQASGTNANALAMYVGELENARISIFRADAIRSFLYISAAFAVLFFYGTGKLKTNLFIGLIGIFIMTDLVTICSRYVNDESYSRKTKVENPFQVSIADQAILNDKSLDYRVVNISSTVSTFNESATSFFHKSVGGYHGAKLQRYQDLIEFRISPELSILKKALTSGTSYETLETILNSLTTLNMLNTKYIILDPTRKPLLNPSAMGNAWFVEGFKLVDSPDLELAELDDFRPNQTAVIDKKFTQLLQNENIGIDNSSSIGLVSYEPNYLVYETNALVNQIAVFSEVYYDKGWNAYIDGEKTSYFRANYVLRAMVVPSGKHKIEFKFEPVSYNLGVKISFISSLLLVLLILVFGALEVKEALIKPGSE